MTEPLISEIFCRIEMLDGGIAAQCYLLALKNRKNVRIVPDGGGDKMAFQAGGLLKLKHKTHSISIVDCYVLAAAQIERAVIYTADHGIWHAAKEEKCNVSFIPKEGLEKYMSG
ncbi:hypothetical protein [Nitrososphaera sp.]|uniref:hypothetical protein n=1 Tax=Nitrososphaera sp. TaxID=1971748 RepID=UPI00307E7A4B